MGRIAQSPAANADGTEVIHDECSNAGTDAWSTNPTRGLGDASVIVKEQW